MLNAKCILGTRGSLLLEGLVVMTIVSVFIVIIFATIRGVNTIYTRKIEIERATLVAAEILERVRSARDTELNLSTVNGWQRFVQVIADHQADKDTGYYAIVQKKECVDSERLPVGAWCLRQLGSDLATSYVTLPEYDYKIRLLATFPDYKNAGTRKVTFATEVCWKTAEDCWGPTPDLSQMTFVRQQLTLTDYRMYENLY